MKLKIVHFSEYQYSQPVIDSINEIRLKPRNNYRQYLDYYDFRTEPSASIRWHSDYFKNEAACFEINEPHQHLTIATTSVVATAENEPRNGYVLKRNDEQAMIKSNSFRNRYAEYLHSTTRTQTSALSQEFFFDLRSKYLSDNCYDTARGISRFINQNFSYSPGVTSIHTTVDETIQLRCGVCQDFAHLMLALCRDISLPARYVSGYQYIGDLPENIGNDNLILAMHAWVEVHIPGAGWLGFDPTNDNIMSWRYVKVADGRDYTDIVPIKGLYRGNALQTLTVKVKIDKLNEH